MVSDEMEDDQTEDEVRAAAEKLAIDLSGVKPGQTAQFEEIQRLRSALSRISNHLEENPAEFAWEILNAK